MATIEIVDLSHLTTSGSRLLISPDHPVCLHGTWFHPEELAPVASIGIQDVFSFVVSGSQAIIIDGVPVASVGMYVPRFPDPFWGSEAVVNTLRASKDWPSVTMSPGDELSKKLEAAKGATRELSGPGPCRGLVSNRHLSMSSTSSTTTS